jgi:hypothetical protein
LGNYIPVSLADRHQHLFADTPVFLDHRHANEIRSLVEAVYRIAALPGYMSTVLAGAPRIATIRQPSLGVFNGFDFHVTRDGPRLIEINTNAGGAMLNAFAQAVQPTCCGGSTDLENSARLQAQFVAMFRDEWELAHPERPLRTVAIVDAEPEGQYLYPEFVLFQQLFERHGIEALIVDPAHLEFTSGGLFAGSRKVDLVYNRLTDFYLQDPRWKALHDAYTSGVAVVSPSPHAHALLASKRNLSLLCDAGFLASVGADPEDTDLLARMIPRTELVAGKADAWWVDRKRWFFKPAGGFGSRGAYRGDKLTRGMFRDVIGDDYVAQEISPPGLRARSHDDQVHDFKFDVRAYVYEAEVQMFVARLYEGQTTNFRTAGGGFAPIYELSSEAGFGELLDRCLS